MSLNYYNKITNI